MNVEFPDDMREYSYSRRTFFWRNLRIRLPAILLFIAGIILMQFSAVRYTLREMAIIGGASAFFSSCCAPFLFTGL